MKKIIHVIVGLDVGGAELMLKRLIESHQDGDRYEHVVISLTDIGTVGTQLQNLGIHVTALAMDSIFGLVPALWRLTLHIRAIRPDIVQTWMYHADLLGGIAARIAGCRNIIWGVRTTEVSSGGSRATALVRKACAILSSIVPAVIVCAAAASRRAHLQVGYDAGRMVVIPNGFDVPVLLSTDNRYYALPAECNIDSQSIVIGNVGRFNPDKDQETFVRAAGLLADQHADARFLMVGRGLDAANAQLAQWIADTGHADRFVLLGERSDVPVCFAAMDIFCLSSRTEGFPNVVGEAMANGIPCVVTDVGDAAMLVADTGVVVPKEDAAALAGALALMFGLDATARRRLGARARSRIEAEFTIDRTRLRFEEIYEYISRKGTR